MKIFENVENYNVKPVQKNVQSCPKNLVSLTFLGGFLGGFWDSTGGLTIFLVDVNYNGEMTRNSREQDTQRVLGYPKMYENCTSY